MSEPLATHTQSPETGSPEIGDVLASIRRLIAQDEGSPDFSGPGRRTDNAGLMRSTLPLGPRAEKLRSVIERELGAIDLVEDRLVLGAAARSPAAEDRADPEPVTAREARPVHAVTALGHSIPARLVPIPPASGAAARTSDIPAKETEMMLAEMNRNDLHKDAACPKQDKAFDLFAADAQEDEDHLSGGNALRNLVRDVIRQELQGDMGERISRNLRRAIRQEVTAAIAAGLRAA